ncbi:MAG: arginine--tRNA ligase, partial [Deltaproteobacteria bacterium]|nr:arginine--tRNA ligase [Deltaproteobacteria bacterium]
MEILIERLVSGAIAKLKQSGELPAEADEKFVVGKPRKEEWGDYAVTAAMGLAKSLKRDPLSIANLITSNIEKNPAVDSIEVVRPGFINFRITPAAFISELKEIRERGSAYGRIEAKIPKSILVEFVSANPTGPLHVGHGRAAVFGDILCNLLEWAGGKVEREYYVNDIGRQMNLLGLSLYHRGREALGIKETYPEECYKGDYVRDIAGKFLEEFGESCLNSPFEANSAVFIKYISDNILDGIKSDLEAVGTRFDRWFRESFLHESRRVERAISTLAGNGYIYNEEGKLKFKSTLFGDEEDRVLRRDNGLYTYFASDVAYHIEKFERGYDVLIDIWGSDHHGYIPRVNASIEAAGFDRKKFEVLLIQFVSLLREGQAVSMSTRSGEFIPFRSVIDEVGGDAIRFFILMRRCDAHVEFDLELAKKQSLENPVYYVQYGHARICSILRKAAGMGYDVPEFSKSFAEILTLPEEIRTARILAGFPYLIKNSALAREPHHVTFYLIELIKEFHSYYTKYKHTEKVLSDDK